MGDATCSPANAARRSCEGSCHAFLPPVPRRWETQPALLRTLREGLAKVAAMPSCRPCLVDGRHNRSPAKAARRRCHAFLPPVPRRWATQPLSCEGFEKVLRRQLPCLLARASPMGGRAALLRRLREGAAMPSCRPCLVDGRHNRSLANTPRRPCEGSCHAFLPPVPRRWATQLALLRRLREGLPNALYISPKP